METKNLMTSSLESNVWKRANTLFGRPKNQWKTIDHMIYDNQDYFSISADDAKEKRFLAIKESLRHHYDNNKFYHELCKEYEFSPEKLKEEKDLKQVPMVPDTFFKEYPKENPRDIFE